jgi:hypothetical protein
MKELNKHEETVAQLYDSVLSSTSSNVLRLLPQLSLPSPFATCSAIFRFLRGWLNRVSDLVSTQKCGHKRDVGFTW